MFKKFDANKVTYLKQVTHKEIKYYIVPVYKCFGIQYQKVQSTVPELGS